MIKNLDSSSSSLINAGMDPFASLNDDINRRIVALFDIRTLACCFSVSKPWMNFLQHDVFWMDIAKILQLKEKNKLYAACTKKLQSLITAASKAETLKTLKQPSKPKRFGLILNIATRHSLEEPHNRIKTARSTPKIHQDSLQWENKNLEKKFNQDMIMEGFRAQLRLIKLGLGSEKKLHELADALLDIFSDGSAWERLAQISVDANDQAQAMSIVGSKLQNMTVHKNNVYVYLLGRLCERHKYAEAIDFFKQYFNEPFWDIAHYWAIVIFDGCLNDKLFKLAEQCLDEFIAYGPNNYQQIKELIKKLVSERQNAEVKRLVSKYYESTKTIQDAEEAKIWISIFVLAGELTQAESIAKDWQRQDEACLKHYKKCLQKYGYAEEVKN